MKIQRILIGVALLVSCLIGATAKAQPFNCGTTPYPSNTGFVTPLPVISSPQVWRFLSEPALHPMKVEITKRGATSPGLVLVAPYAFAAFATYGQSGALILDDDGNPVWFRPLSSSNLLNADLRVQKYDGKKVFTFWQGTMATPPAYTNLPAGSAEPGSCYYILDDHYRVLRTVTAQRGFITDLHEFIITPRDSALLLATRNIGMDLTPYGGPSNGYVLDFSIQEIDIRTNRLLFFWDALQHIPLTDSYVSADSAFASANIWDPYHVNSIDVIDNSEGLLVSARHTFALYKVRKSTGAIIWRLGGKRSDFSFAPESEFSWQHDARLLGSNVISLLDNSCCEGITIPPGTLPSHGLLLKLDLASRTAKAISSHYHDPNVNSRNQGNFQILDNGNLFIGWGQAPYFGEFARSGNDMNYPALGSLYDGKMPGENLSYRAYRHAWVGAPGRKGQASFLD